VDDRVQCRCLLVVISQRYSSTRLFGNHQSCRLWRLRADPWFVLFSRADADTHGAPRAASSLIL
jgi:hypothetical protein